MAKRDPLWIQSSGAQSYVASELRPMFDLFQAGVFDAGDFKVTPGSGLAVSSAAGRALVTPSGGSLALPGRYLVTDDAAETSATFENGPIPANPSGNPRLDAVVLHVFDHDYVSASGRREFVRQYVPGVAASGAALGGTLPTLPGSSLLIAEVLVPAGATTATAIPSGNIRDRRPWARGFSRIARPTTFSPTRTSSAFATLSEMTVTGEFSGAPVLVEFTSNFTHSGASYVDARVEVDDAVPTGLTDIDDAVRSVNLNLAQSIGAGNVGITMGFVPTPGRHRIDVKWATGAATATAYARRRLLFVRELPGVDADNL